MKKALLGLAFMIALVAAGCNSNSPKPVAEKFLNSFWHMNYKEAKEVSTDATKQMLEMLETMAVRLPDSEVKKAQKVTVEITKVEENGDKAVVYYKTSEMNDEKKLNLIKQDDKWLVNFTKNDEFITEEPDEEEPIAQPDTAVGTPTNDTATK
ncbi:MAG: DUF4878 domain-containing protein [Flavipsychrobacter sp.]|nr:DUF4878 domain-containing protein [Flavipsychrobacter sp.]